jgi:hypothetical protein
MKGSIDQISTNAKLFLGKTCALYEGVLLRTGLLRRPKHQPQSRIVFHYFYKSVHLCSPACLPFPHPSFHSISYPYTFSLPFCLSFTISCFPSTYFFLQCYLSLLCLHSSVLDSHAVSYTFKPISYPS